MKATSGLARDPRGFLLCGSVLVAGALTCALASSALAQRSPLAGLDQYIRKGLADWEVVGLSIAIVNDDSVVYAKGFGEREAGKPDPVTPHTLFAIGSNTKLFTAMAAGILVDAGKLKWDDPATTHLRSFQLFDPYASHEITIRDLLSHRSGLGRRADGVWYGSEYDRAEVLRRIRYLEPNSSFRSQFGYQNIMFLAAGEAIAAVAGMSWDRFMAERIFAPLGMQRSNTTIDELPAQSDVATPHAYVDEGAVVIPWRDIDNIAPAGSINSSALDMAQWLRMLLSRGSHAGRKVIEPLTLREILSPQTLTPFQPDTLFPSTHFSAYGLGIGMRDYHGVKVLSHTGGIDGMLSLVAFVPERNLGLVVLTNTSGHNNLFTALMYRVLDAYLGAPARDWSRILLTRFEAAEKQAADARRKQEAERVINTKPSLPLERYAGTYENDLYGKASVTLESGTLVYRFGPTVADLEHWHYETFRATGRSPGDTPSLLAFHLNARGEVDRLTVDLQGPFDFKRVTAPDSAVRQQGRVFSAPASDTDGQLRVLVLHDMEGLSGQDDPRTFSFANAEFYRRGQELLVADVNAVIDGLFAGGAAAVDVVDGHGSGNPEPDILQDRLDRRAKQVFRDRPFRQYVDLVEPGVYDAVAVVGMHAKTGSRGFASHTYTLGIDFLMNGSSITETELVAYSFGRAGVPVILASGDDRLGEDLRTMPWIEYVTVKRATSASTAEPRPVEEARAELRSSAKRAIERLREMKVVTLTTPVEAALRAVPPASLETLRDIPGIRYAEGTVTFTAPDFQVAYDGLVALVNVARGAYTSVLQETIRAQPGGSEILARYRGNLFDRWLDVESGRWKPPATQQPPAGRRYHGAN